MTPDPAREIITRRLHPGERLIWHDAPSPWRIASKRLPLIAFLCVWLILPISFSFGLFRGGSNAAPLAFSLIPAIFLAVGVGALIFNTSKMLNAWRTAYGLSNRRLIIAVGNYGSTQSFAPQGLSNMKRTGRERGDITFSSENYWAQQWNDKPGLYGIREPARVEAAIYETLLKPSKEGAPV